MILAPRFVGDGDSVTGNPGRLDTPPTVPRLTLVILKGLSFFFCSKAAVLNWGQFYLQGDIQQYLEMILVVTIGLQLLALKGSRPGILLNILQCTRQSPQQRFIWLKL